MPSLPSHLTLFRGRLSRVRTVAGPVVSTRWFRLAALTFAIAAYVGIFRDALIDDAFITLQYARNLAETGQWGFNAGEISNTATSPLNVLLIAGAARLTGLDAVAACLALTVGEYLLLWLVLRRLGRFLFDGRLFAVTAFCGLLFNPLLVSTWGLEGLLFALCLTAALAWHAEGRVIPLGLALGALILARPDGALLVPIALGFVRGWRGRAVAAGACALVVLPWLAFSWTHLGSLAPDTLLIKRYQGDWDGVTFAGGLGIYAREFPLQLTWSFLLLPAAVLLALRPAPAVRRFAIATAAFLALHFAAYSALRVPPYHWYYAPVAAAAVLLGAAGLARGVQAAGAAAAVERRWRLQAVPAAGLAFAMAVYLAVHGPFHVAEMPIHKNWGRCVQYREIGRWIQAHTPPDAVIGLGGEVGTVSYYARRRMINDFTTRVWIPFRLEKTLKQGGLAARLLHWNFRRLRIDLEPPRYTHYVLMKDSPDPFKDPPAMQWTIHAHTNPEGRVGFWNAAPLHANVQR